MGFAGVLVVLFQLPITRRTKSYSPLVPLAVGSLLFAVGFGMFAFISALGFTLVLFPLPLLRLLGLPSARDYWILVAGMLLVGLSIYYGYSALNELSGFMRLTAFARLLILPYFLILVVIRSAPTPVLTFGVFDLLFALWTLVAARHDRIVGGSRSDQLLAAAGTARAEKNG